ncbi:hypothetical protein GQ37_020610 [Janthinobacterium sp. BJB1]|uniref:hypothetical protein n=1 Tax=Janthinobacterium sp. GW458P TaxID=1981504 RepID=UPI000A325230|nr:hypothetical protein [Janthinobacterium sp. GW458P]MBE3026406.1 hypothetical protein [Janthinobacterium sp. GW458P]PHV17242.1 hypothetical protein CSQ90_07910 [Janthinobacterium sp. BJB303]PJC96704.1 hypothetical protein GQ37_020610 [Janthinobacterium sp. BJB1]
MSSTLDPDNLPLTPDRVLGSGHGKGALGPSDSSDSGSDMQGVPGQDPEELDNDSDAAGTGDRAGVEPRNTTPDGGDIDVDHVDSLAPVRPADGLDDGERAPAAPAPRP